MTKTLTEQWREGTLPVGNYYIKLVGDVERIDFFEGLEWERTKDFGIKEVLAPVPSFDEYCNLVFQANKPKNPLSDVMMCYDTEREKKVVEPLQKKLAIATKALEELEIKSDKLYRGGNDWSLVEQLDFIKAKCQETLYNLKEIEGVK